MLSYFSSKSATPSLLITMRALVSCAVALARSSANIVGERSLCKFRSASFVLTLGALLTLTSCDFSPRGVAPGERAPNVTFESIGPGGGRTFLDSMQGNVTLVHFWASWCEPCIRELPALDRLDRDYREKGFQILTIGVDDTVENITKVRDDLSLRVTVVIDKNGEGKRKFKVQGLPESFLLDTTGKVVAVIDPTSNELRSKFTGEIAWDRRDVRKQIERLLEAR